MILDRENEGDMICAAEFATQENINFMACHAKGLICTPMSAALAGRLGLSQMVSENTDNHSTAFTVSVDHVDTTTGISAAERGYTMRSLTEEGTKPQDTSETGACISAGGKAWRCVGKKWSYRGNG